MEFQREIFTEELGNEGKALIDIHHAEVSGEIAHLPARIPYQKYASLEEAGVLRLFTARHEGRLVGYNVFALVEHHQHEVLFASHDTMFLRKDFRKGTTGIRFLKWCDEQLKQDGAKFITQHSSTSVDLENLFIRMGYKLAEKVYLKVL